MLWRDLLRSVHQSLCCVEPEAIATSLSGRQDMTPDIDTRRSLEVRLPTRPPPRVTFEVQEDFAAPVLMSPELGDILDDDDLDGAVFLFRITRFAIQRPSLFLYIFVFQQHRDHWIEMCLLHFCAGIGSVQGWDAEEDLTDIIRQQRIEEHRRKKLSKQKLLNQ